MRPLLFDLYQTQHPSFAIACKLPRHLLCIRNLKKQTPYSTPHSSCPRLVSRLQNYQLHNVQAYLSTEIKGQQSNIHKFTQRNYPGKKNIENSQHPLSMSCICYQQKECHYLDLEPPHIASH
jgi:hypothetical protein